MTFKAIFFDLGGVIVRTEDKTSRTKLAAEFGMSYEEMDRFVFESPTAVLAGLGKMSEEEHFLDITRRLNLPETEMPRIHEAFFGGDLVDGEIIGLLRSLRQTHKTGLISNAWDGLRPWILEKKFDDAFEFMTISAEVGVAKPDERIYRYALEKLEVEPEQAIFVDDIEENVAGCEAVGMRGVLFRSSRQTLAEVKRLLGLQPNEG